MLEPVERPNQPLPLLVAGQALRAQDDQASMQRCAAGELEEVLGIDGDDDLIVREGERFSSTRKFTRQPA